MPSGMWLSSGHSPIYNSELLFFSFLASPSPNNMDTFSLSASVSTNPPCPWLSRESLPEGCNGLPVQWLCFFSLCLTDSNQLVVNRSTHCHFPKHQIRISLILKTFQMWSLSPSLSCCSPSYLKRNLLLWLSCPMAFWLSVSPFLCVSQSKSRPAFGPGSV